MIFPLLLFQWTSSFSFMTLSLAHHTACYGDYEGLLLLWEQNIVIHLLNFTLEKNCARKVETDGWWLQSIHWTLFWLEKHLDLLIHCKTLKYRWPWDMVHLNLSFVPLALSRVSDLLFHMQSHYRDFKLKVLSLWSLTTNLCSAGNTYFILCLLNLTTDGLISLQKISVLLCM